MKKRILSTLLSALLILTISACNDVQEDKTLESTDSEVISDIEDTHLENADSEAISANDNEDLKTDFFSEPLIIEWDETRPSGDDMLSIIASVQKTKYEAYPNLQNIPKSATLYKYGEVIEVDITDPRLIGLINFFNNALYYNNCHYLLCDLSPELLEEVMTEEFRLELTYEPYGETLPSVYENEPTCFDTIVVAEDGFTLINSERPVYDGENNILIPFTANNYYPYGASCVLLEVFGF